MFNTLRSHLPIYNQFVTKSKERTVTVQSDLPSAPSQTLSRGSQALEYKNVCNVVLITEVDEQGQETPIAIAFVNSQAVVVIHYLQELSELE